MRPLFAALLLGAASAAAHELPMGGEAWQGMSRGVQAYRAHAGPAPVEAAPVRRLWSELVRRGKPHTSPEGERAFLLESVEEPGEDGAAANRSVYLVEHPARPDFSPAASRGRLVAVSEDWSRAPDGARRVEIWRFTLAVEGTLLSAARQEITLRGQSVDEGRSRSVRLRPADPAVQRRWKELAARLLRAPGS